MKTDRDRVGSGILKGQDWSLGRGNLNGVRRKEPILAIIDGGGGGGMCAYVIKCLSHRSGG